MMARPKSKTADVLPAGSLEAIEAALAQGRGDGDDVTQADVDRAVEAIARLYRCGQVAQAVLTGQVAVDVEEERGVVFRAPGE